MKVFSLVNISNEVEGKSVFTQWEHNIVAGYLITAGKMKEIHPHIHAASVFEMDRSGFNGIKF